ncbi:MAG: hypothetical protein KC618_04365 [Candidatus Omnitrophica bacterium]|nr:hypothetical protein [Candidatus Omnitrophota bacterium]
MTQLTESELNQFIGTEHYYRHLLGFNYTDGVKFMAERGKAYWLIDAIASYKRREPFQVWTLKVNDDKSAVLEMREDSDKPALIKQEIPFTDFPLKFIELFLIDGVLLLTSEY